MYLILVGQQDPAPALAGRPSPCRGEQRVSCSGGSWLHERLFRKSLACVALEHRVAIRLRGLPDTSPRLRYVRRLGKAMTTSSGCPKNSEALRLSRGGRIGTADSSQRKMLAGCCARACCLARTRFGQGTCQHCLGAGRHDSLRRCSGHVSRA